MKTTEEIIKEQLANNAILLYMKGTPQAPECGYSKAASAAIMRAGVSFAHVNVLAAPFIRERLPKISQWPTFPQLFVNGELLGGCDIILAMEADGSLAATLKNAEAEGAADDSAQEAVS